MRSERINVQPGRRGSSRQTPRRLHHPQVTGDWSGLVVIGLGMVIVLTVTWLFGLPS